MTNLNTINSGIHTASYRPLIGSVLRSDAASDAPLTSLAYANIAVFTAVLFSLAGLNSYGVIAYTLTAFAIVLVTAMIGRISLTLTSKKLMRLLVTLMIVLNELTIPLIFLFDLYSDPRANAFAAMTIVAGMSFISVPLAARYITPFLLSKITVIASCAAFAIISPAAEQRMVEIMASLTVTLLITIFIGYWIIKKRVLEIRLRLELSVLNDSVADQNQKLQAALSQITTERAKTEASFALRQRLLSYIGHDLRQPVSAASLMMLELSKTKQTAAQKALLSDAQECVHSAGRMIEDVVQITHYNNPAIEVFIAPVKLDDILRQIVREYAGDAQSQNCNIRYVATSVEISSDSDLLIRILRNLLRNALKHSGAKNMVLGVRHKETHVEIWVVDNGRGMSNSTKVDGGQDKNRPQSHGGSLGLGLKISKQLATACGADLTLISQLGDGTCCKLSIPKS